MGRKMSPAKVMIGTRLCGGFGCVGDLWTLTHWAVVMLGNEPRLGAPLAIVVGHPVYNSWLCPSYVSQRRNADSWH